MCERFLGSVRRKCLDILVLDERHLRRILTEYVAHFNEARPHQGIDQRTPASVGVASPHRPPDAAHAVIGLPVLGGLHREYRRAA